MDGHRLFAWVRQFTGTPYVYRAYVRDRVTGKALLGCPHRHRRHWRARTCAESLARSARLTEALELAPERGQGEEK